MEEFCGLGTSLFVRRQPGASRLRVRSKGFSLRWREQYSLSFDGAACGRIRRYVLPDTATARDFAVGWERETSDESPASVKLSGLCRRGMIMDDVESQLAYVGGGWDTSNLGDSFVW
ncbi:hypothetical protein JMJ77_0004455 [Colletotrichum scovillei]|uniref:Uncharacterized protein n=1 Tax=Colletotrichum scovillei TaxID=1209932 RepID=A0A9P7UED6_9PEZI|nr:hypothetical protein JMJ77_0004455 [Colletotrichum scovillei]KAG7049714.1 hypothetical protein JMJ78_0013693 [Colletotrichum scovillei]KAG7064450.1 hypothetical protein JMJ76_0007494 [Colletotrichum scovillei]